MLYKELRQKLEKLLKRSEKCYLFASFFLHSFGILWYILCEHKKVFFLNTKNYEVGLWQERKQ